MRNLCFLFVLVLLPTCTFVPPPKADPSEKIVLKPSATPTIVPLPTSTGIPPATEIPLTVFPVPTIDPNFYRDDFNETLAALWTWVREDPRNWSLTNIPGSLQINVSRGYVPAHTNTNILLRPAPAGNFQIETQITFRPTANFQFAGLIIYQSDSNFIQAGRAYCNAVGCIGEGLYMDYYRKGVIVKPNIGPTSKDTDPIWLRLSRKGDTYSFEVSTNRKVWFIVDSHTSDLNPLQIGLVTGQRLKGSNLAATFDYFQVQSLP